MTWSRHPHPGQKYTHGWVPIGKVGDLKNSNVGGHVQAAQRKAQKTGKPAILKSSKRAIKVHADGKVESKALGGEPLHTPNHKPVKAKADVGANPLATKSPKQKGPGLQKQTQTTSKVGGAAYERKAGELSLPRSDRRKIESARERKRQQKARGYNPIRDANFGERRSPTETVGAPKTRPEHIGQNPDAWKTGGAISGPKGKQTERVVTKHRRSKAGVVDLPTIKRVVKKQQTPKLQAVLARLAKPKSENEKALKAAVQAELKRRG